jgi:hypothetical protein
VVEYRLGVPTGCAGKLRWQTAGMFGEAAMAEPWDGVGEAAMVEPTRHTSIRLSKDNHDSWVTCTTSAKCKSIIRMWVGHGETP